MVKVPRNAEPPPSFDVTVEQIIGTVKMGSGDEHPFIAAMNLVSRHAVEALDNAAEFESTYTFAGPGESDRVRVTIALDTPRNTTKETR